MPTMWERDLEGDRARLLAWFRKQLPAARDVRVSELVAPQSSGFSNETLLFDLAYDDGTGETRESLVLRIQPIGFPIFPEYDLGLQFRTMQLLAATDVPVPRALFLEERDTEVLGAPFYVMSRVEGRVPPDQPPYHQGGWMTEISPAERGAIFTAGFEILARIHRLDYSAVGFDFLDKPEFGATGLAQQMGCYERFLAWAARGREQPIPESALEWLRKNEPADDRDCLNWGDARIGNIIFDGTRPAAVLDWEMVTHGSPEIDVGWSVFLDRHHSEGIETPRLEGFPSYEESIARYEEMSGFEVKNLHYYQVFAGFRFAVIMMRIAQQLVQYEILDAEAGYQFELNNTVTRLLAGLLDLPAPGDATGAVAP